MPVWFWVTLAIILPNLAFGMVVGSKFSDNSPIGDWRGFFRRSWWVWVSLVIALLWAFWVSKQIYSPSPDALAPVRLLSMQYTILSWVAGMFLWRLLRRIPRWYESADQWFYKRLP